MGWFEESDEEDCKIIIINNNNNNNDNNNHHFDGEDSKEIYNAVSHGNEDCGIDPLDAFMSGIDQQLLQSSQKKQAAPIKSDRLDVANEEEATSHWQCLDTNLLHCSYPTAFQDDGDSEDGNENENTGKTAAAASFLSSFQKAGSSTKNIHKPQHLEQTKTHPDVDDEEEDLHLLKEKHRHVEPLDKCNHTLKTYPPFRKVFHHPQNTDDGKQWRSEYDVSCSIDTVDPIFSFAELGSSHDDGGDPNRTAILPQTILQYLDENGYKEPTLVQSQCIPLALYGKDLIVTSHTGSGKTLAYLLPLIAHILDQPPIQPGVDGPIALILSPTRELTKQISIVGKKILKLVDAVAYAVTGGMGTYEMTKDLRKGCSVVITTPGRWIDMIKKKASNMDRTTLVILDEADKMLDMGFETQVASILENIRPDRQSWMFSATFGRKVERVAKRWLKDPIRVAIGKSNTSSEHVTQNVIVLPSYETKKLWMKEMLPILADIGRLIIFVSSRVDCEQIAQEMRNAPDIGGKGYVIGSLHGDKHQSDRNSTLAAFRKGTMTALVATDVASRGLDVTDVMTVINFDVAKNLDAHIHRIGRCGRLSVNSDSATQEQKKGNAYTILTPSDCTFANILLESFLREGREVSNELMELASKSKHFGGGGRHQSWNKSGLGYDDSDTYTGGGGHQARASSYYGPSSQPASKRPRLTDSKYSC